MGFLKLQSSQRNGPNLSAIANSQHEDHHDGEYLKRVAGHIAHDSLHRQLLRWAKGNLPSLLQFQCLRLFWRRRLPPTTLCFLVSVSGLLGVDQCANVPACLTKPSRL